MPDTTEAVSIKCGLEQRRAQKKDEAPQRKLFIEKILITSAEKGLCKNEGQLQAAVWAATTEGHETTDTSTPCQRQTKMAIEQSVSAD